MKKKGFTLIEILVALAIFILTITFFYQYSANSSSLRRNSVKYSSLDKLSDGLLQVIKDEKYSNFKSYANDDKFDRTISFTLNKTATNNLETKFPKVKEIVDSLTLENIDINKVKIDLKLESAIVEYFNNGGSNDFDPPSDMGNQDNRNHHLAYKHWKPVKKSGAVDDTKINPFESEADKIIEGTLTLTYPLKNNNIIINRDFYIFE